MVTIGMVYKFKKGNYFEQRKEDSERLRGRIEKGGLKYEVDFQNRNCQQVAASAMVKSIKWLGFRTGKSSSANINRS